MLLFVFILNNKNLKRMCLSAFVTAIPRYFLNHYVLHSNPYNVSFRYIFLVQLSAFLICLFKYWVKSSDYTYLIFILFLKNLKKFRATWQSKEKRKNTTFDEKREIDTWNMKELQNCGKNNLFIQFLFSYNLDVDVFMLLF